MLRSVKRCCFLVEDTFIYIQFQCWGLVGWGVLELAGEVRQFVMRVFKTDAF